MENTDILPWLNGTAVYWGASIIADGSMRLGGSDESAAREQRRVFFEKQHLSHDRVVSAGLVHGAQVHVATASDAGKVIPKTDALVTTVPKLTLAVTSADCLPVYLADPKASVVGIVHAGWRGLAAGVILATVKACCTASSCQAVELAAYIGPAICARHYAVRGEVARQFFRYSSAVSQFADDNYRLDLSRIAKQQLEDAGLRTASIASATVCTYEEDTLFSNRRDKPAEVEAQLGYIGLRQR